MDSPSPSQQCGVCLETADSVHFGGLSCRACAAFFRRKVASRQTPSRRCAGKCKLSNQILRRLCQSCRFKKCLEIGMQPSFVISRLPIKSGEQPSTSTSKPLVEQLNTAYTNLLDARKVAYHSEELSTPEFCNYKKMNEMTVTDMALITEHFLQFFRNQMDQAEDYHEFVLPHFMVPFMLFEGAFRSVDSDLCILANGDVVDVEQLNRLYWNPDDTNDRITKFATVLFEPYWKLNKQTFYRDVKDLKLELTEFLLLCALIYWDFGLQNQTDEWIEICQRQRSRVLQELTNYEKNERRNDDHCLRIGQIMIVLQSVQKAFKLMIETRDISMVYDVYDAHCHMFEMMKI